MPTIACPSCGEAENLRGEQRGGVIAITCGSCGTRWHRDTRPRCRHCGSEHLRATPIAHWAPGRGTMQTPVGRREAWACLDCGASDVTREPG